MILKTTLYRKVAEKLEKSYRELIEIPSQIKLFDEKLVAITVFFQMIKESQNLYLDRRAYASEIQDEINFDWFVSQMAEKGFRVAEIMLEKWVGSRDMGNHLSKGEINKINDLVKMRDSFHYVSARWNTMQLMTVFDLGRKDPRKMKVPKRYPLLKEVCFCYDRVLAVALGIIFEDGFNPNRGVICLPPSSGKTYGSNVYTDLMLMHFWLRYKETGLIRMTNTATNAQAYGGQCIAMIQDPVFREIFPEVKKYVNTKGVLDIFKNNSQDKCLLKDCNSECTDSIFMFGVDARINGKRSQLGVVLDDLSGGMDEMDNDEAHMKITDKAMGDVADRSDDVNAPIIVQGTMFNENDTQNTLISKWENKGMYDYNGSQFIRVTNDGKCFTCLVDIEDNKGNSIAPELYSNEQLEDKKQYFEGRGKLYVFNLIYRQKRDSREPKTFGIQFLQTYDYGRPPKTMSKYASCMLDTTRRSGNDYFSMPYLQKDEKKGLYYLTDTLYEQKSLGLVDDPKNIFATKVANKIISMKTTNCCIENNTSNTTGSLLKGLCDKKNYKSCKFKERYTTKKGKNSNKFSRILNMETTIKNYIVFPKIESLPYNSPLRLAMKHLTEWNSKMPAGRKNPDDFIDSLAMWSEENVFKKKNKGTIRSCENFW